MEGGRETGWEGVRGREGGRERGREGGRERERMGVDLEYHLAGERIVTQGQVLLLSKSCF